jgi:hypothetical protein
MATRKRVAATSGSSAPPSKQGAPTPTSKDGTSGLNGLNMAPAPLTVPTVPDIQDIDAEDNEEEDDDVPEFEMGNVSAGSPAPEVVIQDLTPALKKFVNSVKTTMETHDLVADLRNYHWYSMVACLPFVKSEGTPHPLVRCCPKDKLWQNKVQFQPDDVVVGPTTPSAYQVASGFMVSKATAEAAKTRWSGINILQRFASQLTDRTNAKTRVTAVWFHREGEQGKVGSHYHILMGTETKWDKANIRNEVTSVKMKDIDYKRWPVLHLGAVLVHHTQPRPGAQFLGCNHVGLIAIIKNMGDHWAKIAQTECDSITRQLYAGTSEHEEQDVIEDPDWAPQAAAATAHEVTRASIGTAKTVHARLLKVEHYKHLLKEFGLTQFNLSALEVLRNELYASKHPWYPALNALLSQDSGWQYRKAILSDVLNELAIDSVSENITELLPMWLNRISFAAELAWRSTLESKSPMAYWSDMCLTALVLLKRTGKVGCVFVTGPRSVGKTLIFNRGLEFFAPRITRTGGPSSSNQFDYEELCDVARYCIWEEFGLVDHESCNVLKTLWGGQSYEANRKYMKRKKTHPMPFICLANENLTRSFRGCQMEVDPIRIRTHCIEMTHNRLPIHGNEGYWPLMWMGLLYLMSRWESKAKSFQALQNELTLHDIKLWSQFRDFVTDLSRYRQSVSREAVDQERADYAESYTADSTSHQQQANEEISFSDSDDGI